MHGIATQIQEHLGVIAEALAGKGAGSACDAYAVGKELPTRWRAQTEIKRRLRNDVQTALDYAAINCDLHPEKCRNQPYKSTKKCQIRHAKTTEKCRNGRVEITEKCKTARK